MAFVDQAVVVYNDATKTFLPSNAIAVPTNSASGTLDFGFPVGKEGDTAIVTVSAPWVGVSTKIYCWAVATSTADHDPEDSLLEAILCTAINVVVGVSFDIEAYAPQGTWGRYVVYAVGIG